MNTINYILLLHSSQPINQPTKAFEKPCEPFHMRTNFFLLYTFAKQNLVQLANITTPLKLLHTSIFSEKVSSHVKLINNFPCYVAFLKLK